MKYLSKRDGISLGLLHDKAKCYKARADHIMYPGAWKVYLRLLDDLYARLQKHSKRLCAKKECCCTIDFCMDKVEALLPLDPERNGKSWINADHVLGWLHVAADHFCAYHCRKEDYPVVKKEGRL